MMKVERRYRDLEIRELEGMYYIVKVMDGRIEPVYIPDKQICGRSCSVDTENGLKAIALGRNYRKAHLIFNRLIQGDR